MAVDRTQEAIRAICQAVERATGKPANNVYCGKSLIGDAALYAAEHGMTLNDSPPDGSVVLFSSTDNA